MSNNEILGLLMHDLNMFKCLILHFFCLQFKESALRKQSLYLKFDPLLRESPKKSGGPAAQSHGPRPVPFVSQYDVLLFSLTLTAAVTVR